MPQIDLATLLALLAGALLAALFALWIAGRPARTGLQANGGAAGGTAGGAALLFRDGMLADANAAGRDLVRRLGAGAGTGTGIDALAERLSPTYPGLTGWLSGGGVAAELPTASGAGPLLDVERGRDSVRLRLRDAPVPALPWSDAPVLSIERRTLAALEEELAALRAASEATACPVWHEAGPGAPVWRNAAAAREGIGPRSFDPAEIAGLVAGAPPERLRAADGRWWDVRRAASGHLTALPADAAVAAQTEARRYAMALVETFAHLPVGLAVFAPDRRLRTFNPAFAEMTGLDPATLARRPDLRALCDRLREARILPAGTGWEAWLARIADLESGARAGGCPETWDLPDGRAWRVSARPHPGGAMALLLEDVTTEAELARRFHAELAIGQAIADTVEEALAVFAANGTLIASNAAYAALWGTDPRTTLADGDIAEACGTWAGRSGDARWHEAAGRLAGRPPAPWALEAEGPAGPLRCTARPVAGGATLLRFGLAPATARDATAA